MTLIDNKTQLKEYAKLYNSIKGKGTDSVPYGVLPDMFKKYVTGHKALDFGCGCGYSTLFLKSQNFNAKGVDINLNMVHNAIMADPKGIYLHIQEGVLPFADEEFDLVFSAFVLLEIDSRDKLQQSLNEISRVLRKGGKFVTIIPSENFYKHEWATLKTNFPENANVKSGDKVKVEFLDSDFAIYDTYWSQDDYIEFHRKAGLEMVEINSPLAVKKEKIQWKDELHVAPASVYVSVKG